MKKTLILLAIFSLLAVSCMPIIRGSSHFISTSYTDPDYFGKKVRNLYVQFDFKNIQLKSHFEDEIADHLSSIKMEAYPEYKIFPNTREWTTESKAEIIKKFNIASALLIRKNKDNTKFKAEIIDLSNGRTVWAADMEVAYKFSSLGNMANDFGKEIQYLVYKDGLCGR